VASRVAELRKRAVVTAAGAAAMGAAPMLAMTHGHRWLGYEFMAVQVVLIGAAIRFVVQMRRAKAGE
jgi:hypothetical protein